jgi:hypothetical protein
MGRLDAKEAFRRWSNPLAIGACVVLLIVFAIVARNASYGKCATFDEPASLVSAWVQTHFLDFRAGPENPPLYKYYIGLGARLSYLPIDRQSPLWPVMLKDMDAAGPFYIDTLYRTPGVDADQLLNSARARMIILGMALGAVIAWWAWRWRGPIAAVAATAAYALDPNFLGHSPLLKNDVPVALALTGLSLAIWLLGERVTAWRWIAVALLAGVAMTTKFSGVFAIPVVVVTMLARAFLPQPWPWFGFNAKKRLAKLDLAVTIIAGVLLASYLIIWACYGFRFEMSSDPAGHFDPQALTRAVGGESTDSPNHPSTLWMGTAEWIEKHHVLPEAWIVGLTYIHNWSLQAKAFLCGNLSDKGWWYYFPLAMLFKTPTSTLLALLLVAIFWIWRWRKSAKVPAQPRNYWPAIAAGTMPVLYFLIAMSSDYDIGLRHIFPVYPMLFVIIGVTVAEAWKWRPRLTLGLGLALLVGLVVETSVSYPNYIAFFNVPSGGSRGGLRLLSNSNLDWGQDLPLLQDWQQNHPDRPVCLLYIGSVDPAYYRIPYFKTSDQSHFPDPKKAAAMHAVLAVSATVLQGTFLPPGQQQQAMATLRSRQPLAVLGGSIYLYEWK